MRVSLSRAGHIAYALVLLALVCWFVIDFPILRIPLTIGFVLYAGCLWRWPWLWLIAVPTLLPLFDLAPWSGRFFFDEFDAFILLTACVLALNETRGEAVAPLTRAMQAVLALLIVSYLVSTFIRLWPFVPITADSFANYASPYNSLRVAKGFVWALVLLRPLRQAIAQYKNAKLLLGWGFLIGLAGVSLVTLYERWLFAGVLTWVTTYRTMANFSSMHTGDGHIDVWLAMSMPFIGLLFIGRRWLRLLPLTIALALLSIYALVVTESRGPVIAVAAAYAVGLTALFATRSNQRRVGGAILFSFGATALFATAGLPLLAQTSLGQRFFQTGQDATIRLNHWRDALSLRDRSLSTQLFGMGPGSFPAIHQQRSTREPRATRYRFVSIGSDHFLTLWPGQSLFMTQAINVAQNTAYTFNAKVRSPKLPSSLTVELCEKWLLSSQNCTWDSFNLQPEPNQWQNLTGTIHTGITGSGRKLAGFFFTRPTKLTFFVYSAPASSVDVGEVGLKDPSGRELVQNGDFSHGADHWFWTVDEHLQWHTKNLAVNILFDQGWLGILAVGALLATTLVELARQIARGDQPSAIFLASMTGFIVNGVTVSTFDQPRLTMAFYLLCFAVLVSSIVASPPAQSRVTA